MKDRPEVLEGYTLKLPTPCGAFYLTLNEYENKLFEVRCGLGKSGTCYNIVFQTLALLISVILQSNIPREKIKKTLLHQFEGNCGNTIWFKGERYHSCIDFMIQRILEDLGNRGEIKLEEEEETTTKTTTENT